MSPRDLRTLNKTVGSGEIWKIITIKETPQFLGVATLLGAK